MFAPAAPQLAKEFNLHSSILTTMTVTIPSLGAATGPLLFAPLSEIFGRVNIYIATSLLFLAFAAGLARSTGIAMFLVFRFLDGVCFASYMTCGAGTIADLFERENRGAATAVFSLAPLLGPVLGPVMGGFVAQQLGWRWIFYIILIMVSWPGLALTLTFNLGLCYSLFTARRELSLQQSSPSCASRWRPSCSSEKPSICASPPGIPTYDLLLQVVYQSEPS
jgi:multidrug resistance protein